MQKIIFLSAYIIFFGTTALVSQTSAQTGDPFAAFKETVVETDCVIPRIDEFPPYGRVQIGPEGGAKLVEDEAEVAHQCLDEAMREGYGKSDNRNAQEYLDWARISTAPYLSRAHHNRYAHHFANDIAREHYQRFEGAGTLPVGSVIAKDSFVVSKKGRVVVSALSIMEKKQPGYNPDVGDWHFMLVLPDGRIFGDSEDSKDFAIKFCNECHQSAGPEQDYLYFMPKRYRSSSD